MYGPSTARLRRLALALGMLEALLIGRLVALLLAANPANPFVALLLGVSAPLVAPLAGLDAGQPLYGSRFERGTLLLALLLPALGYALWRLLERGSEQRKGGQSYA